MKILNLLYYIAAVILLSGAIMRIMHPQYSAYVYTAGALLLAVIQFIGRVKSYNFIIRRLVFQQQLAGICLVAAGVLMFTHVRNEWIVAMFVGALLELYTAYRIPQELEKEK